MCCEFPDFRAVATVDTAALCDNFRLLRNLAGKSEMIAVVKANAYGHGAALVVPALYGAGCRRFAVASLGEAVAVRKLAPEADVLILGYTPPERAPLLVSLSLTQTVFSREYARALSRAAPAPVRAAFKADGGMCRLGFDATDADGILAAARLPRLLPESLYTHFPCAENDPAATRASLARFRSLAGEVAAGGLTLPLHAAASAALLSLHEAALDRVRAGLALYGIPPVATDLPLRPVLTLSAPVVSLRAVNAGTPVGYGGTFRTVRRSLIGVLPIGYADGLPRAVSDMTVTLLHAGCRFAVPLAGRICMDQCTVDLTDTPAALGDTVVLYDDPRVPAARANTIPYEILTALSPRVTRRKGRL